MIIIGEVFAEILSVQYGYSSLILASFRGHQKVVEHLIEARANVNVRAKVSA